MSVGEMEAVVFDTPVIKHYAGKDDKVQLVPGVFHPEYYGFCFLLVVVLKNWLMWLY